MCVMLCRAVLCCAQVFDNVLIQPRDAREASDVFYRQRLGDVLLTYENEVVLTNQVRIHASISMRPGFFHGFGIFATLITSNQPSQICSGGGVKRIKGALTLVNGLASFHSMRRLGNAVMVTTWCSTVEHCAVKEEAHGASLHGSRCIVRTRRCRMWCPARHRAAPHSCYPCPMPHCTSAGAEDESLSRITVLY